MKKHHRQCGIGLLEVLITVFIMAVGFLAIARMQIESLKNSQSAYFHSQAYLFANEMIERVRLNPDGVESGAYDNLSTNSTTSAATPTCAATGCSSSEQAVVDLAIWRLAINPATEDTPSLLPSSDNNTASGNITRLDNNRFNVEVTWAEIIGSADTEQSIQISFVPTSL